jgi:hypothetical protein
MNEWCILDIYFFQILMGGKCLDVRAVSRRRTTMQIVQMDIINWLVVGGSKFWLHQLAFTFASHMDEALSVPKFKCCVQHSVRVCLKNFLTLLKITVPSFWLEIGENDRNYVAGSKVKKHSITLTEKFAEL